MTTETILLGAKNLALSFAIAFLFMIIMVLGRIWKWKRGSIKTTGVVGKFLKSEGNYRTILIEPVHRGDTHSYDFSIDCNGSKVEAVYTRKVKNHAVVEDLHGTVIPIYYKSETKEFLVIPQERKGVILYTILFVASTIATLVLQFGFVQ